MLLSRFFPGLLFVLLLSGCGFNSLYGSNGSIQSSDQLATIKISQIKDRIGQQVRNELLDLLTPHGAPRKPIYILSVSLVESKKSFAVQKNAFATRADLRLSGSFQLNSFLTGQQLTTGNFLAVSSYDIVSSDFATLSAEKNARERSVLQVSEDIRTRLAVYFVRQSKNSR
jgi:LPS-assembly lipoprotein